MSRPKLTFDLPADTLRIVRWDDPVLDAIGHDPRSSYVERFWLSLLGPCTTFLIRRIARRWRWSPTASICTSRTRPGRSAWACEAASRRRSTGRSRAPAVPHHPPSRRRPAGRPRTGSRP